MIEKYKASIAVLDKRFSIEAKKEKIEDHIRVMMREFAELGVDINKPNWCDNDYMRRYNHGVALISQIYALNQQHELSETYFIFVRQNTKYGEGDSDGVCKDGAIVQ